MYRTSSVLALGLFLGLAPATVFGQQDTQQQDAEQLGIEVQDNEQQDAQQQDADDLDIQVQEDQQQAQQQAGQQPDQQRSAGLLATEQQGLMVESMIGADVYSAQGDDETVGSIDDVLISVDGQAEGVIIGVGGWLGVGERDVLVPMEDLSLEAREDELRLVLQRTREDLENEPEFRRVDEQQQADTGTGMEDQPGATLPDESEDDVAEQDTMQPQPRDGQIVFQDQDSILASTMIGADMQIGSPEADEDLGEISDVVITMDGRVEGVVVGVGGFLGLGEKEVVVAMDRLDIQRTEDDEVRVSVLETRESLEAAEGFERPQQGAGQDTGQDTGQESRPATEATEEPELQQ